MTKLTLKNLNLRGASPDPHMPGSASGGLQHLKELHACDVAFQTRSSRFLVDTFQLQKLQQVDLEYCNIFRTDEDEHYRDVEDISDQEKNLR